MRSRGRGKRQCGDLTAEPSENAASGTFALQSDPETPYHTLEDLLEVLDLKIPERETPFAAVSSAFPARTLLPADRHARAAVCAHNISQFFFFFLPSKHTKKKKKRTKDKS